MTPERWQEVKKVLAAVLERPPEERSVYLDQACTEPSLRMEVESLIVWAIAEGRSAARAVDQYLMGGNSLLK